MTLCPPAPSNWTRLATAFDRIKAVASGIAPILAAAALLAPHTALAQDVNPERREQFIEIMSHHDCRFHNFNPSEALIAELFAADFDRAEIRAMAQDLIETEDGVVEGPELIAKTGACAE
ncbi:MAG: hypothetical protein AAGD12_10195 [Pseudomonadota bacterium]